MHQALLLCVCLLSGLAASAVEIDLVLLAGQSNMVGRAQRVGDGLGGQIPGTSPLDAQVRYYFDVTNTGGSFADDSAGTFGPLTTWTNSSTAHLQEFGPELALGRAVAAERGNEVALIKLAVGGAGIRRWQPGEVDYEAFVPAVIDGVSELINAGHTVNVLGMAWLQGESDMNAGNAPLYGGRLQTLVSSVRDDFSSAFSRAGLGPHFADLPVVLIEPAESRTNPSAQAAVVDQALRDFAVADANAQFVATDDLLNYIDDIHFGGPSQTEIGRRIASSLTGSVYVPPASRMIQPDSIQSDSPRLGDRFDIGVTIGQVNTEFDLVPDTASASRDRTYATQTGDLDATLTMDFDTPQELTDLLLWNYRNGSNNDSSMQGVTAFSLSLYDGTNGTGTLLYERDGLPELSPAIGDIAPQHFGFGGTVPGVRSAVLTLSGGGTLLGFHELGFLTASDALAGDYNHDGLVDAADYALWRDGDPSADGTGDGQVNAADYTVWANHYGTSAPTTSHAVPEPTGLVLAALGLLARRRTR